MDIQIALKRRIRTAPPPARGRVSLSRYQSRPAADSAAGDSDSCRGDGAAAQPEPEARHFALAAATFTQAWTLQVTSTVTRTVRAARRHGCPPQHAHDSDIGCVGRAAVLQQHEHGIAFVTGASPDCCKAFQNIRRHSVCQTPVVQGGASPLLIKIS